MKGYGRLKVHRNWWITVDPTCDIGEYYRYLYNLTNRARIKVQKPKWGSHITLVRSEEPVQNKDKWHSQDGNIFEFYYQPKIITGDNHIWINVTCKKGTELRQLFGLPERPEFPLHLTLGYIEFIYDQRWLINERKKSQA